MHAPILLHHRGGLGDFLTAWPSMLSIREHLAGAPVYWVGPPSRLHWLRPLGVRACPGLLLRGVDALFGREGWPVELGAAHVYWFVLDKRPPVPFHPHLHVLYGMNRLAPEHLNFGIIKSSAQMLVSPREAYGHSLRRLGIAWNPGWLRVWRNLFGRSDGQPMKIIGPASQKSESEVFLFPGAGHPAKQWPLVKFFELAHWLEVQGRKVRFVLGPAELERDMDVKGYPLACPDSTEALQELLLSADLVVGNDSGPMHLAGMLGIRGVALFGPASERQWAPVGLRTIGLNLECRPCTRTGRISCPDPWCIRDIPVDLVCREVADLLGAGEAGQVVVPSV